MLNIERITNYENDQNCYIFYKNKENAVIVDPGSKFEVIYEEVKRLGVKITHIFLTHCHYDHIESVEELRKAFGALVVSSFECNKNIQTTTINLSGIFSDVIKASPADIIVNDNDIITVGEMKIRAILTPGHTNGSACFLIGEDLFSGDTLFLRNVGRWDLPTGDEKRLMSSIKNKLYVLDDDIIVHPGHGNDTKIYYEKRYNTFVRG